MKNIKETYTINSEEIKLSQQLSEKSLNEKTMNKISKQEYVIEDNDKKYKVQVKIKDIVIIK